MPDYVTAYQISKLSFASHGLLLLCIGAALFLAAAVIVFGKLRFGWKKATWSSVLLCCFVGSICSLLSGAMRRESSEAFSAFESGRYATVEGVVTDFHPTPRGECFSVDTQRFCYADDIVAPGFRDTARHGGPIRERLRVRIAYAGPTILRLEIASDEMMTAADRAARIAAAAQESQAKQDSNTMLQGMTVAMSLTSACWCFWASFQWQLAMRTWRRPPNRWVTPSKFRALFGLCCFGSVIQLSRQLYDHPLTRQNVGPAVVASVVMITGVSLMTAGTVSGYEQRKPRTSEKFPQ